MSGLSTYLANQVLNWLKGTDTDTAPTSLFVALFDGNPTDAGSGGTEVTTDITSSGRVEMTLGAPSSKLVANDADVDYGNAENDASISHVGVFDDATAGNMLGSFALPTPRTILAGDPVKFVTGDLVFDLTTP